jgi:hypothetical protein
LKDEIKFGVSAFTQENLLSILALSNIKISKNRIIAVSTCTSDTDMNAVDDFAVMNHPIHASTVSTLKRLIDIFGAIIGLMVTAVLCIPFFDRQLH